MGHRLFHQVGLKRLRTPDATTRARASRPRHAARLVAVAGLMATLVLLATPLAGADHVFSHRVHIVGRVVDIDGTPVAGADVHVEADDAGWGGACFDTPDKPTGPRGDFALCRHTHALKGDEVVRITVGNVTVAAPVDADARHAWAHIRLDGPAPARDLTGVREFAASYHVDGRFFRILRIVEQEEGVNITARPAGGLLNLSLVHGEEVLATTTTGGGFHGEFQADFDIASWPNGTLLVVEYAGTMRAQKADDAFRRSDVVFLLDAPGPVLTEAPPGSQATPAPGALATVAVLGTLGLATGLITVSGARRRCRR